MNCPRQTDVSINFEGELFWCKNIWLRRVQTLKLSVGSLGHTISECAQFKSLKKILKFNSEEVTQEVKFKKCRNGQSKILQKRHVYNNCFKLRSRTIKEPNKSHSKILLSHKLRRQWKQQPTSQNAIKDPEIGNLGSRNKSFDGRN